MTTDPQRVMDLAEAQSHLVQARERIAAIDLRHCNAELKGALKELQTNLEGASTIVHHALILDAADRDRR